MIETETITQPGVNFSEQKEKLFSNIYFKLCKTRSRFCVLYGGASSGKSYAAHQRELIAIMKPGKGDTLVMRKNAADLRESCYKLFQTLIIKYDLSHLFKCTYGGDHRKIICLHNGRSLIFRGIDEPEKLKSIVGISRIVLEEANQFDFEDFLELNRRARGLDNIQIILILNPISENHWIKKKLCDADGSYYTDTTLIKATYKDNCNLNGRSFLTETDIEQLENLKGIDENHYRIYVLGEWGIDNKENKFCYAFDQKRHVITIDEDGNYHDELFYDNELLTWLSFDFNVDPMTCIVAQVFPEDMLVKIVDCIKLPNSDIYKMCERIQSLYSDSYFMITGDASGNARQGIARDSITYYKVIQGELGISPQNVKLPSKNPSIEDNRMLVNAVLTKWDIQIDGAKCKPLTDDMLYVETTREGAIIKDRSTESKKSDFLDCFRYLCNIAVRPHFNFKGMK